VTRHRAASSSEEKLAPPEFYPAESSVRVLLSVIVVIGFIFLVILGALCLVADDLLATSAHRQPSFPDEFPEEDRLPP
jgi:hypothetical protein